MSESLFLNVPNSAAHHWLPVDPTFTTSQQIPDKDSIISYNRRSSVFSPVSEIVVDCAAYQGHSGGPCVNQDGRILAGLDCPEHSDPSRLHAHRCTLWGSVCDRGNGFPWLRTELVLLLPSL